MDSPTKIEKWVPIISMILFAVGSTAYAAWSVVEVDVSTAFQNRTGLENKRLSLIDDNGQPAISYAFSQDGIRYTRHDGSDWNTDTIESEEFTRYDSSSMTIIDGRVAFAFSRTDFFNTVQYASQTENGWQTDIIEPEFDDIDIPRIALATVDNNPAVAYNKNEFLQYAVRTQTGWEAQTVAEDVQETSGNVDYLGVSFLGVWDISLVEYNSRPTILYSSSPDGMKLATLVDGEWQFEVIQPVSEKAYNPTLAIIDGQPAITYHDDFVYYALYDETTMQWQHTPVAEIVQDGTQRNRLMALSRLTTFNDQPAFAFSVREDDTYHIRVAFFNGSEWFITTAVSSELAIFDVALADINGVPMIAYYQYTQLVEDGQSENSTVAVKFATAAIPEDLNTDGNITPVDAVEVLNRLGQTSGETVELYDVDGDGDIDT
ncbi:MAG: dockerin type I domain-containing protein, partial [Chloroflexota bacterium]